MNENIQENVKMIFCLSLLKPTFDFWNLNFFKNLPINC